MFIFLWLVPGGQIPSYILLRNRSRLKITVKHTEKQKSVG